MELSKSKKGQKKILILNEYHDYNTLVNAHGCHINLANNDKNIIGFILQEAGSSVKLESDGENWNVTYFKDVDFVDCK